MTRVDLQPYSRSWKWLFLREKLLLTMVCGTAVNIQHFGSTAIPGLVCKPIIDILLAVSSISEASSFRDRFERLGYEYRGENGELRQHYYVKGAPEAFHLYVVEQNGETWLAKLAFRDYLRGHPDFARRYAELKLELAGQFATDPRSYQNGKKDFVEQIVLKARSNSRS